MKKELIYIGSVNKAIKAKNILLENKIKCKLERVISDEENGCGYSLLIVDGSRFDAIRILKNYGVELEGNT